MEQSPQSGASIYTIAKDKQRSRRKRPLVPSIIKPVCKDEEICGDSIVPDFSCKMLITQEHKRTLALVFRSGVVVKNMLASEG